MAIASFCHVTVTACHSEGCIRVYVFVEGVDSCLHERDMTVATISLYVLCILSPGWLIMKVGRDIMDRDFFIY